MRLSARIIWLILWTVCEAEDNFCGNPPHVENAVILTSPMTKYPPGSRVRYECNKPFEIFGEVEVMCQNGIWTEPPKCKDSTGKCGRPPPIENGDITSFPLQAYAPSSSVEYQCQSYYQLAGNSKITCRNGEWSEPPKCLLKSLCSQPPEIDHGSIILPRLSEGRRDTAESRSYEHGTTLSYVCDDGFRMPEEHGVTCNMGKWSAPPRCVDNSCGNPPHVENAVILTSPMTKYPPGSRVRYECNKPFEIFGEVEVMCQNGIWTEPPKCKDSTGKCGRPPPIENGDITSFPLQAYAPSSSVEYQCQSYYQLAGNSKITCRNGEWSEPPKCLLKSPCSQPPEIDHGSIILPRSSEGRRDTAESRSYEHGTTLSYVCDDGFRMPEEHGVTCNMGKWSAPPLCVDSTGKCGRPPPVENGDITSFPLQAYVPSSSVEYQCQSYYRLAGNSKITCRNGEWSEPPKCLHPCVISEETMERHNITYIWIRVKEPYLKSGDLVEFLCKYGYKGATKSPPFRTMCIDGHINYPSCTKKNSWFSG